MDRVKAGDLLDRLEDHPFRPFRMHLSDGTRHDVTDSGLIMVGESSAIMPTAFTKDEEGRKLVKHWRTVAIDHIARIGDINETVEGKQRKRK
jgi:hypothetical protein